MGIKSFFRNLGRGIKRGWNSFTTGAANVLGNAGTWLQQKAIPSIAKGATAISGLIGKATPLLEAAGPEAAAAGAEAAQISGKVGDVVGKFADYIGSNAKAGRVANAQEIAQFQQSPFGQAIRRSQGLPPVSASVPVSVPKPAPSLLSQMNMPKGLISPAPLGSNPNTYTPKPMNSGIEAPPAVQAPSIIKIGAGNGGTTPLLG
tara:strand:+ start:1345 stop:1956 length:612 start_codon:yes stop_codon:yes gene_type:complete